MKQGDQSSCSPSLSPSGFPMTTDTTLNWVKGWKYDLDLVFHMAALIDHKCTARENIMVFSSDVISGWGKHQISQRRM